MAAGPSAVSCRATCQKPNVLGHVSSAKSAGNLEPIPGSLSRLIVPAYCPGTGLSEYSPFAPPHPARKRPQKIGTPETRHAPERPPDDFPWRASLDPAQGRCFNSHSLHHIQPGSGHKKLEPRKPDTRRNARLTIFHGVPRWTQLRAAVSIVPMVHCQLQNVPSAWPKQARPTAKSTGGLYCRAKPQCQPAKPRPGVPSPDMPNACLRVPSISAGASCDLRILPAPPAIYEFCRIHPICRICRIYQMLLESADPADPANRSRAF
ncbi:hypothetical protein METBIDRAFT_198031 [Metschnikowia bicuspidata var. bicuspidata NRRL YB-4993]|uniref:Uncharacterized protein n=1 Tax=Metschnikowia bicuspidata var. bicuspidata NRRL YB-4993 TaxID=869754 RepID=A0A1A0H8R3_9ASCO|nr:hypothetical protein METBIDRAFT_198031 [Metschnikowia bicuspidata var. bicuspidata NRRL YB-4993]OBA20401.1 hypothetical protein METBIDRAFT_198031 [Metschnikowia bicuspidata var. bicuspidata NRRL YB-4993]